jgi:antitoxin component of MazEF toxin-antitoxin module
MTSWFRSKYNKRKIGILTKRKKKSSELVEILHKTEKEEFEQEIKKIKKEYHADTGGD